VLTVAVVLATAAVLLACHGGDSVRSIPSSERTTIVSQLPSCTSGADMRRLDGQRVRLTGVYRRALVAHKQGEEPTHFLGHVDIELTGQAIDYDPSQWDGAGALVSLGTEPRSGDEVARFTDQTVTVEGRLVLHPRPADPEIAQEDPPPTLVEIGAVTAAQ
jgi:hypothetical protein